MSLFHSNTVTAKWDTLFDEDNKPATIYKTYPLTSYKMMMNEDLRSCEMCLLVGENEDNIDTITNPCFVLTQLMFKLGNTHTSAEYE